MIHLQMLHEWAHAPSGIKKLVYSIWPEPYAAAASVASVEDGLYEPTGQVFLIYENNYSLFREHETLVGITGYFDIDSQAGHAYLRWTGVIPKARNRRVFRTTIALLTLQLKGANPSINRLIELVPDNEYGHSTVIPAFERCGFKVDNTIKVPVGEDADWPVIPYVLNF